MAYQITNYNVCSNTCLERKSQTAKYIQGEKSNSQRHYGINIKMVRKVDQNRSLSPFWDSIGQGPVSGAQVSGYYSEHLSERDFQSVKNFIIVNVSTSNQTPR